MPVKYHYLLYKCFLMLVGLCQWIKNVGVVYIYRISLDRQWGLSVAVHGQCRSTLKSVFPEPFKCCQSTKEVWTGQTITEVKCTWKWCASTFDLWEFYLHWLKNAWKHLCDRLEIMLLPFSVAHQGPRIKGGGLQFGMVTPMRYLKGTCSWQDIPWNLH